MKNIRRKKLGELLNSPRFAGDRSVFWAQAGITNSRLTQLLDPDESFGEIAASNLVDSLRLDKDFFTRDTHHQKVVEDKKDEQVQQPASSAASEYTLTSSAIDLAMLFDMIPESSRIRRAQAFSAAADAIVSALEGRDSVEKTTYRKKQLS